MATRHPALLGIDVGTSSVKLLLHFLPDRRGGAPQARVARARLAVRHPAPGASEAEERVWWRGIRAAAARLGMDDARVLGIGTSTLFPALVPMDVAGRPVRPAILYDDCRSAAEVAEFERAPLTHPALQHLLTGNRLRPGTIALSGLLWMRRHEGPLFRQVRRLGLAGTYIGMCLTDRYAMDATSASLTGLYATASGEAWLRGVCRAHGIPEDKLRRPEDLTYGAYLDLMAADKPVLREQILADLPPGIDREALLKEPVALPESGWVRVLVDALGLDRPIMPEVLWPGDRLEPLSERAARALGLEPGTPVAAGAGDTACGALGMGLTEEDELAATCGSTDSLLSLQRTAAFSTRTVNIAHMDAHTWLAIAPMNATGAAVDWFVGRFIGRGPLRYARFFSLAAQAPPGSKGVVFLPYLAGERSPVYDHSAKGVFFGLTHETGLPEMARAVLEGIAFGHRQILRMTDVRLGRPVERVVAAGGATANGLWRRIRADAADRPYLFADRPEASALGAALLGGVAAGIFPSWREAAAEARRTIRFEEVRPDPAAWHQLNRNFEVYSSLYDALKHCFEV